jgi:hypothetical protein
VRERLVAFGPQPTGTTPGQLNEIRIADSQFWQRAVIEAGITVQ